MPDSASLEAAKRARYAFHDLLTGYPNVIGVAVGLRRVSGEWTDEAAVQVFVSRKYPRGVLRYEDVIPAFLPGPEGETIRTDVIDAGFFCTLDDTAYYRPLQGGCSIGPAAQDSAGTLGGFVWDNTDQTTVLLTCNHVLSPDNQTIPSDAAVLQPAKLDGGFEEDGWIIGQTKRLIPIAQQASPPGPATAVDCAVASLTADTSYDVDVIDVSLAVFQIEAPALGTLVQKRGKRTELTTNGHIVSLDATWSIQRPLGWATTGVGGSVFNIASTDGNPFCDNGDSGSIIFDQSTGGASYLSYPAIGLLFAGGQMDGQPGTLIGACTMSAVFSALDLDTICSGVINDMIQAVNASAAGTSASVPSVKAKAAQLRQVRDTILAQSPAGRTVAALVAKNAAVWSRIWLTDEKARGLAVRAMRQWISASSTFELLECIIDAEIVRAWAALVDHMSSVLPEQEAVFRALHAVLAAHEGKPLREVLRAGLPFEA
jgi:hypothetical protein